MEETHRQHDDTVQATVEINTSQPPKDLYCLF